MAKHKCKVPEPPPDTGRWMGTYGDMVTLLMAFFVMLFAVSETSNQKFQAFVAGLAGPFDNPAFELGLVDGAAADLSNASPIDLIAPRVEVGDGEEADGSDGELDEGMLEEVEEHSVAAEQLDQVEGLLREVLEGSTVPIQVDLRDDERGLVVSISTDDVLFAVGSADISAAGRQLIGELAPVLVDSPNTVVVEGHTDDQPLNTGGYTNWNLSTDRAVAVLELLGDLHGMPYDRISAAGYGEHRPLMPNDSPAHRSINRRVEILVVGLDIASSGEAAPPPSGPAPGAAVEPAEVPVDEVVVDEPGNGEVAEDAVAQGGAASSAAPGPGGPAATTRAATLATILGDG